MIWIALASNLACTTSTSCSNAAVVIPGIIRTCAAAAAAQACTELPRTAVRVECHRPRMPKTDVQPAEGERDRERDQLQQNHRRINTERCAGQIWSIASCASSPTPTQQHESYNMSNSLYTWSIQLQNQVKPATTAQQHSNSIHII